ncbi:MAG: LysM peptidoglycan-binding domain-containing protein [Clostridiales bacterium]|nr:LysM peptidoglycan-binding domain-containing protein [Clostridiales bacterium]
MKEIFYRVIKEDSVTLISDKFNLPSITIIEDNHLKKEVEEGDILVLRKEDRQVYKVGVKETIETVCKKFNIEKEEFIKLNKIDYVFYGLLVYV